MTETLWDEGPGPFDMAGDVPFDLLDVEPGAIPEGVSYLRIGDDVLEDGAVVRLLAGHGAVGVASWFTLLVLAKRARAFGVVRTHAFRFGQDAGCTADEASAALETMERVGLVWLQRDPVDPMDLVVRVRNWQTWQSMTDAERQRLYRARKRYADVNASPPGVTPAVTPVVTGVGGVSRQRYDTKTGDRRKRSGGGLARTSATPPARGAGGYIAPLTPPADDWPDAWEPVAVALRDVYQTPEDVLACMRSLMHDAAMRRLDVVAIAYGVAETGKRMRREPGWIPDDVVRFVIGAAKRHRPDLHVPQPTPNTETHDDRPVRHPSNPELVRFD